MGIGALGECPDLDQESEVTEAAGDAERPLPDAIHGRYRAEMIELRREARRAIAAVR